MDRNAGKIYEGGHALKTKQPSRLGGRPQKGGGWKSLKKKKTFRRKARVKPRAGQNGGDIEEAGCGVLRATTETDQWPTWRAETVTAGKRRCGRG